MVRSAETGSPLRGSHSSLREDFTSLLLCLPNSSFKPYIPDLNVNKSYGVTYAMQILFEFYPLPKLIYSQIIKCFFKLSTFPLAIIHSSIQAKYEANELSPLSISSSHLALSKPKDTHQSLYHMFSFAYLYVVLYSTAG